MMNPTLRTFGLPVMAGLLMACAKLPPAELVDARIAMTQAQRSPDAALVPADLHKAEMALAAAEASFAEDGDTYVTRDLAYVAHRKAQLAATVGQSTGFDAVAEAERAKLATLQGGYLDRSKADLAASAGQLAASDADRAAADFRAFNAELRAASAIAELAAAREEARGMVITLSGSVLFRSGEAELLPAARVRLQNVADALLSAPTRRLLVEGHTDSDGGDASNLALSQARADAVRTVLVDRGYRAQLIEARGIGEVRPIADNGTQEGKSNNRRVEIIVSAPEPDVGALSR